LPEEREIHHLKAAARFVDRFIAGAVDRDDLDIPGAQPGDPLRMDIAAQGRLHKLGESMLAKRERLARMVLGEAA
jgi:hypothetical protein